jgi:hypothetical protein
MVSTKFALVSSLTGPIQQTRYVDGCKTAQNIFWLSGRSQGMDLWDIADPTARIPIIQFLFQIHPSMVLF